MVNILKPDIQFLTLFDQIHHSKLEIHHNKNFGVVFSLWDYIFQSLKTSKELNQLKFGLNDNALS